MYVKRVDITHVRAVRKISWVLPAAASRPGWHVVVGDNGSGKTSFLRSIGLALVGPATALQLRQSWDQWLTKGQAKGRIRVRLERDAHYDKLSGKGGPPAGGVYEAMIALTRKGEEVTLTGGGSAMRHVWGKGDGWFAASYGPMRRFTGGDPDVRAMFYKLPRLGRHLSLFDERAALAESLDWLRELRFGQLANPASAEAVLLESIQKFVNRRSFLPFHARLDRITATEVRFVDGNQADVEVENLSDGYRSVLSLTFELIRQLALSYGLDAVFTGDPPRIDLPGVVLIDEIDAHLHPTWQLRIGTWFRRCFPRMQFIVTSHSPLVCRAADPGTVFRLPRPGHDEAGAMVTGDELKRLVYGNVLDAFGTEVFGEGVTSSEEGKRIRHELAELNVKEVRDSLTAAERKRQGELRRILPTAATSPDDHD